MTDYYFNSYNNKTHPKTATNKGGTEERSQNKDL